MAFKAGDVVRLKSGGPAMTIEKIGQTGGHEAVFCTWFEKNEQKRGHFAPVAVEADEPGPIIA